MANYPPLAIGELALIGRAYRLTMHGGFPDTPRLTMMIKGAIVLVEAALFALLIVTVRRDAGDRAAWWSAAAFALNPALIIAAALGYLDVFFALPAVGALIAASRGWPAAAGALLMAGLMTKPQAVFVAPAVALALWHVGPRDRASARLRAAFASASIVAAVLIAPIVAAGTTLNMLRAVGSIVRHDMLSGGACNLWWIVSYGIDVAAARHEGLARGVDGPGQHRADLPGGGGVPRRPAGRHRVRGRGHPVGTPGGAARARSRAAGGGVGVRRARVFRPVGASTREPLLRRDPAARPGSRGATTVQARSGRAQHRVRD